MDMQKLTESMIIRKDFFEKAKNENPDADLEVFDKLKESFVQVSTTDDFKNLTQSFLDIEASLKQIQDEVCRD